MLLKTSLFLPAITGVIVSFLTFAPLYSVLVDKPEHYQVDIRVPGQDNLPPEGRKTYADVRIGEFFESYVKNFNSELTGSWSSFRGNNAKNISTEKIALLDKFPEGGPPVLWQQKLGEGHAAPVIHKGRVYILDYLEEKSSDALRCFSLLDGKELWRRFYRLDIKRNHGYSRTVPAVNDDYVVSMGPMGHLMCLDARSGELRWTLDVINEFKATVPQWYSGQCPLIDGDTVVIAPGGEKALVIGLDIKTGEKLWQTDNPGGWKMSHSSLVPMYLNEQKMYVYAAVGGIAGIAAEGENTGKLLWQSGDWGATVVAPSPVILNDGYIFQSAGYGAGSMVLKISSKNQSYSVEVVHRFNPKEALATEQQSAIFYKDLLFGILTKDAGTKRMRLVACKPQNPSEFVFSGNSQLRFGLGPMIIADNKFFALADDGNLSLLTFNDNEFERISQAQVLPGVDAWGPLAVADGIMLLRDSTSMACIDLTHDSRWNRRQSANADK